MALSLAPQSAGYRIARDSVTPSTPPHLLPLSPQQSLSPNSSVLTPRLREAVCCSCPSPPPSMSSPRNTYARQGMCHCQLQCAPVCPCASLAEFSPLAPCSHQLQPSQAHCPVLLRTCRTTSCLPAFSISSLEASQLCCSVRTLIRRKPALPGDTGGVLFACLRLQIYQWRRLFCRCGQ